MANENKMGMDRENMSEDSGESCYGGTLIRDAHDEMRSGSVDIGGKETTTDKLMSHQTGDGLDG